MTQNGILNVYKPAGMSSFKCVSEVRRKAGIKKAGHAGTLDPNAEGILPVLLGKATRLNEFFLDYDKGYRCEILFGKETDSCDIWGNVIAESDWDISEEKLKTALESFKGKQMQMPPIYSAIKKDGVPMYKLARKGLNPEMELREVYIYSIVLLTFSGDRAVFDVTCSKGTYVRSLCRDIGRKLGTWACMSALTRTHYGPFNIKNSVRIEDIDQNSIFPMDSILGDYDSVELDDVQKENYINGKSVYIDKDNTTKYVRLYYRDSLLALAETGISDNRTLLIPWKYFGE